jgi:hypothetical protein
MIVQKIDLVSIGKVAREALAHTSSASVLGKTSRGLFLHLPAGWVIFLSLEAHPGPLTLNLQADTGSIHHPEIGSMVYCSPGELSFPGIRIALPGPDVLPWQAPQLPVEIPSAGQIRAQLLSVARLVSQGGAPGQLAAFLPGISGFQEQAELQNQAFGPELARLQAACRTGHAPAIAAALQAFLGLGPGLSPSGDDLITGFLLAANRWGERLGSGLDLAYLNRATLSSARKATNSLSASLIECAALGQADERLILALDGIIAGVPDAGACVAALAGWGSSSGFDALVGITIFMIYLILALPDIQPHAALP